MSSPVPFDPARKRAAPVAQMSPANRLRKTQVIVAPPDRDELLAWWEGVLRRNCASVPDIARTFTCTEQTARYWLDRFACPTGLHLDHAMALWPHEAAARYGTQGLAVAA